ncbi:MAG: FAD-dependent oxidoreductase [Microbacteriaceae bacterium]|nr:FAD-dependent oxidoreductase [Microbacteriaceae bacterium]
MQQTPVTQTDFPPNHAGRGTLGSLAVNVAIVGWGKGGKTLAVALHKAGKKVAVIEQSEAMQGGTCINIGCVPTKALVSQAEQAFRVRNVLNGSAFDNAGKLCTDLPAHQFTKAVAVRDLLIKQLREVNHAMLADIDNVAIVGGKASFAGTAHGKIKTLLVSDGSNTVEVTAETVVINTGSVPAIPEDITGIPQEILAGKADIALPDGAEQQTTAHGVYTSTTLQHADPLPRSLVIIGAGFIALEFAAMFANFGAKVTVLNRGSEILPGEDEPVRASVTKVLAAQGIEFVHNSKVTELTPATTGTDVTVSATVAGNTQEFKAAAILLATGRKPATAGLNLAEAEITTGDHGEIVVDEFLQTNAPGVFAIGDVNGGPQHTYISLDDFRIVKEKLLNGSTSRSTKDRVAVPATTFITPPFSQVGLTASAARQAGHKIKTVNKPVATIKAMPRPKAVGDSRGIISIVVDAETDLILGARLFHVDSQEVINLIALAMRAKITASTLRDSIWTHPASTEALNEVLAELT